MRHMFNSIGKSSNFAQAGKAAADDTVRAFAASRRNSPKYGDLAQKAYKIRSEEKIAAMKAESVVAQAGIKAKTDVTKNQILTDAESNLKGAKRKAGALAAAGQLFGNAGQFLGEERTKRTVGEYDSYYTGREGKARADAERLRGEAGAVDLTGGYKPMEVPKFDLPGSSSTSDNTSGTASSSTSKTAKGTSQDFQGFVDMAKQSGAKYPQLVAAQWALESGWGSTPSGKNNYFGIKATSSEAGTSKQTWEVEGGKEVTTTARFKDYSSPQGSVNDLVNKWHKDFGSFQGVNNAPDAFAAADMLRQQGYATDPKYAEKLKKIMQDQGF